MVLSCVSGPEKSASQEPHVFKVHTSFPFPDGVLRNTGVLSFGEFLLFFSFVPCGFGVTSKKPERDLRASLEAQLVKNRLRCRRPWFDSWVGKLRWRRDRLPALVCLGFPGGSAGKEPPAMPETPVQSLGWEDPLEKGKATHSSILTWRIPRTVWSMGSHRVGHD